MSYFAPYIDESGVHMPTYEDRLEKLVEDYRGIFGVEAALTAAVPDYQLLSVFAKALDDTSALVVQDFASRNPMYASGSALDLLLPQYGLTRAAGETDAAARARIQRSLAGRSTAMADSLRSAVLACPGVRDAKVYVNDTGETDGNGVPGHSVSVVVRNGQAEDIVQAIFDKKAPGIGTYGNVTENAYDAQGAAHPVSYQRYSDKMVFVYVYARLLDGGDQAAVEAAVPYAVADFINELGLGKDLTVPQLYGVAYAADPAVANSFVITDIQVTPVGGGTAVRDVVSCGWSEKITAIRNGGVTIRWS